MRQHLLCVALLLAVQLPAQKVNHLSVAFTDQASAYPFAVGAGYFKSPLHPGIEVGWDRNFREKSHHDWFGAIKLGYFYHRFVQHGIPLYVNYGYRYRFSKSFSADVALGAGYLHSVAATEVLQLNDNGDYKNAKGIGRPQVMVALTAGTGYQFYINGKRPARIFLQYQGRIQTPFVKSYVPVLPYNQVALGASFVFSSAKKQ